MEAHGKTSPRDVFCDDHARVIVLYRSKQRENPRLSDVVDLERFLTLRHLVGYTDLILIML